MSKGVKSTEFWAAILFVVVLLANGTDYVSIPGDQITLLAAMLFGYGAGRTLLKNTTIKKGQDNATRNSPPAA